MSSKFFHCSPYRLKYGTILLPQYKPKNFSSSYTGLFLSISPLPHYTLSSILSHESWFIYQVLPLSNLFYGRTWDEIIVDKAIIIKYIGNTKPHLKKFSSVKYWDIKPPKGLKLKGRGNFSLRPLPPIDLSLISPPLHFCSKSNRYLRKKIRSSKDSNTSSLYSLNLLHRENPYFLKNRNITIL